MSTAKIAKLCKRCGEPIQEVTRPKVSVDLCSVECLEEENAAKVAQLRPAAVVWMYWSEQIVIEEDAQRLPPVYMEVA